MKITNVIFILVCTLFVRFDCQIHYVPAQILIPTINGTHIATNHSVYNISYQVPQLPNNNIPTNNYTYRPYYNNTYNNSSYNLTRDGHLIVGSIQPFDRLLFNQEYFLPRRWWSYREKTVEYPSKDLPAGYSRHETISALRIYNKFYDGNTASAAVVAGGVGRQYVKINLESKWGRGFRYIVQIFGH